MSLEKIYDPVHGFIHFNQLERELIDSPIFQRLHGLHQLGMAYLVYPGATHTRFEHSLGTMEVATRIFDQITLKGGDSDYYRQAVRFAALCHDLGHLPFSHTAEKRLLPDTGHEHWTALIIQSEELAPLWKKAGIATEDILKMALAGDIISDDFIGADRIDYLLRDSRATGLSYGLFDYSQLIEMLCVLEDGRIAIFENGLESCEALLLARHFMYKRLYHYPAVKAYNFHLARVIQKLYGDPKYTKDLNGYLSMSEAEVQLYLAKAKDCLDTACIHSRKKRFKAIAISGEREEALLAIKKQVPEGLMEWEFSHKKPSALTLPVLRKNGQIASAAELSEVRIPVGAQGFVYIAPEYEHLVNFLHEFVSI
jgi:HD superfamily phosphohydrolase